MPQLYRLGARSRGRAPSMWTPRAPSSSIKKRGVLQVTLPDVCVSVKYDQCVSYDTKVLVNLLYTFLPRKQNLQDQRGTGRWNSQKREKVTSAQARQAEGPGTPTLSTTQRNAKTEK